MAVTIVEKVIGGRTLRFETGRVAKLASGAVMATYAETCVLATCVRANPRAGIDFFPLTCDYREKTGAAGKFPGGFRKREGAPNEKEILTMRMIDRPIRPLFPDGFCDEIQLQAWVMSHDGQNDSDVIACTAASAALYLTDAPYLGPVATVRVGRIITEQGERFIINPTQAQIEFSDLDLVLSGHKDGINMIEVGAAEVDEATMLRAIRVGYDEGIKPTLELIEELRAKCGAPAVRMGELTTPSDEITKKVKELAYDRLVVARKINGKKERNEAVDAIKGEILKAHFSIPTGVAYSDHIEAEKKQKQAKEALRILEKKVTHYLVAQHSIRADGRKLDQIRDLDMSVEVFPRTHGSAFFQRGETQSLVTCTLGTVDDEQIVDGLLAEYAKKFYLHYNFPPFCTGEAGRIMGPGRRELGHGALAERSLLGILPTSDDFPYTIRLVSDITESNGSSSMATVCGASLSLMDAGVPLKRPCAGIAMGLIKEDRGFAVLSDILGDEDHLGDMDFKVAGTEVGITSLQMDIKITSITPEIMRIAVEQAREGRLHILGEMAKGLTGARTDVAATAPRITVINVPKDKIRDVIGSGGKVIREITEQTGTKVDIEDDGTIKVAATSIEAAQRAIDWIRGIVAEPELGAIYNGKVVKTADFGAFVNFLGAKDGLVHISELANDRVNKTTDIVKDGDAVKVKVIGFDERGKVKLSMRVVDQATGADISEQVGAKRARPEGDDRRGGERGEGRERPRG